MMRRTPLFQASLLAAATFALAAVSFTAHPAFGQALPPTSKNAAAAAPQSPYHGEVVADIIARVNDQVISSADYARADAELEAQAKQRNFTAAELEDQKRQLLRDLIDNQLLLSKGKQLGITGETETVRQLDELRKQNNLDSMEALEKAAEQQGVSFADFKASIQNRVITSQVIRDEVGRRISLTQAEEQQYYNDHQDQFTTPEHVKLSEILVPTPDADNAAEVSKAQAKADALEAQLKAGKDFAELAKTSSGGSTAAQGGALGDWKRGALAKVLEDAVFPLPVGKYTEPIRTKQGFIILKVEDHTKAGVQSFTEAQPQVEDALGSQKMNPALRQYLTRLREEAYIDIKPGFVDSASSSNETRPIFSAYQPPQPKKKKKLDRTRFAGRGRTRTTRVARNAPASTPAPPSGVPSLADVPGSTAPNGTASAAAGTTPAATPAASSSSSSKSTTQTASAGTLKPGKREKVRFGQAPRETLPAADTRSQDAGASTDNGNGSNAETASAAQASPDAAAQGVQPGAQSNVGPNARYANGESATDEQAAAKKTKTRFSARVETKTQKKEKKRLAKVDPFPPPPVDSQEVADKSIQAKPLGLKGDTSQKVAKPKPTTKTRYSDEAGKKSDAPANTQGTAAGADGAAPAGGVPPVSTQPYKEPSPQNPPGTDAPVNTQTTPTGSGDPISPPTPAQPQSQPQP